MPSDPIPQPGSTPDPAFGSTPDPVVPTPLPHASPGVDPSAPLPVALPEETSSGLTPNVAAGLSVVLTIITGIIFLFLEKRSQFVRFWAMQAVFFGAAVVVFLIVAGVIHSVLAGIFGPLAFLWWLLCGFVKLGLVGVWLVMLFQAFSGSRWELPFIGPLARQQLAKTPLP